MNNWVSFSSYERDFFALILLLGLVGCCWVGWRMFGRSLGALVGGRVAGGMAGRLRGMTNGAAYLTGFSGTIACSDTLSGYATIVGYSSCRLMTTLTATFAMRGAMAGELILLVLVFVLSSQPPITLPIAGCIFVAGFAAVLLNWRGGNLYKLGRTLMGLSLLLGAIYALQLMTSPGGSYSVLADLFARSVAYTWDDLYSQILGVLLGIILTAVWKSSFLTILLAMTAWGYLGTPAVLGLAVGAPLGLIFPLAIMSTRAGSSARRATVHHGSSLLLGAILMVLINFFVLRYTVLGSWSGPLLVLLDVLIMVLLAVPFSGSLLSGLAKPIANSIPNSRPEERLQIFSNVHRPEPALSLVSASVEVANHTRRVYKMVSFLRDSLLECEGDKRRELYSRIRKYESITRRVKDEILLYTYSAESTTPAGENLPTVRVIFNRIIAIERIASTVTHMADTLELTDTSGRPLSAEQREALSEVILSLQKIMYDVIDLMENDGAQDDSALARNEDALSAAYGYATRYYPYHQVEMIDLMLSCRELGRVIVTLV